MKYQIFFGFGFNGASCSTNDIAATWFLDVSVVSSKWMKEKKTRTKNTYNYENMIAFLNSTLALRNEIRRKTTQQSNYTKIKKEIRPDFLEYEGNCNFQK